MLMGMSLEVGMLPSGQVGLMGGSLGQKLSLYDGIQP